MRRVICHSSHHAEASKQPQVTKHLIKSFKISFILFMLIQLRFILFQKKRLEGFVWEDKWKSRSGGTNQSFIYVFQCHATNFFVIKIFMHQLDIILNLSWRHNNVITPVDDCHSLLFSCTWAPQLENTSVQVSKTIKDNGKCSLERLFTDGHAMSFPTNNPPVTYYRYLRLF